MTFGENTLVFGANIVVFLESIVVFGQKKGGRIKGRYTKSS